MGYADYSRYKLTSGDLRFEEPQDLRAAEANVLSMKPGAQSDPYAPTANKIQAASKMAGTGGSGDMGVAQGALSGAAVGSAFGPYGTAIGAGIGGISSLWAEEAKAEEARRAALAEIIKEQNRDEAHALDGMRSGWAGILR